jgi:hypothetical protein
MKFFLSHMFACLLITLVIFSYSSAQESIFGLEDRAFTTHNINRVGYFSTNIGQFYPYGGQFEKTLEYPINSGHICMYRQCLMIGVPVNVVSAADGRFEEFDAVGGYNSGDGDIAISDNPATWPSYGWPVQDANGNPIFLSQQDSYCVYSDSTNWRYANNNELDMLLDIRVHQTIYTWAVQNANKFHIMKFRIENVSNRPLTEMYFNFYSDLDIGGIDNAAAEWADDCVELDKSRELVYFYDSDNYSDDWGEPDPFLSGVVFLETPNGLGITDFHWIDVTIDEVAVNNAVWDSVSYYLMRSDTTWFHNRNLAKGDFPVADYFHLGDNPINGTHFDDPATSRIVDSTGTLVGGAMVAYICNGPFDIQPDSSAEFLVGVMVGDNEQDLLNITDQIWDYYNDEFRIPVVPAPVISGTAGNRRVDLQWSNSLDVEYINNAINPPANDLEGYILYRTTDQTLRQWETLDTIPMLYKGDSLVIDDAYQYTDDFGVANGFSYFYNLTAYRFNSQGAFEESARLSDINNIDNQENALLMAPSSTPAETTSDVDKIRVVPNPFVISARWDEARVGNSVFGEPIRNIAFTNLPTPCTIRIFTVDGDQVKKLEHTDPTGRKEWDLLTEEQRPVVSGIYFYHVDSDLGEKVGRFAIIR